MSVRLLVTSICLSVGLAACGSSGTSAALTSDLQENVSTIRSATESGDLAQAELSLTKLRETVAQAEEKGEISASRADEILQEADEVAAELEIFAASFRDEEEDEQEADEEDDTGSGSGGSGGSGGSKHT